MAGSGEDSGSADIRLHPTVVMSIADTHTRALIQFNKHKSIGALFGTQKGREVRIYDTIEIAYHVDAKKNFTWEEENFESDMKLFKEVFPQYELLGWFSTSEGGKIDTEFDGNFHSVMTKYNERPLLLVMDSTPEEDSRELPITLFEEQIHVVGDQTRRDFVKAPFKVESDEAERVTAVHCAKVVTDESKDQSVVASHYTTLLKAIQALHNRIGALHTFIADVKAGKVKADQRVLRDLKGLCNRLPVLDTPDFKQDFMLEYNDAALISYLAALTKGEAQVSEMLDRFHIAHAKQQRGTERMMGPVGAHAAMMGMGGLGGMGFF